MKKIIIAEDEDAIREFIVINLQRSGYDVTECHDGNEAWASLESCNFDFEIAIFDIMMPGIDGIELCKRLRKKSSLVGIIILTAKSQEIDKISGLMHGADDYIVKPFSPSELIARVDALYRRVSVNFQRIENKFDECICSGEFSLNLLKRTFKKNEKVINLTKTEFQIIEYFMSNSNLVLSRNDILNRVWGQGGDEKMVDVNVRRLRMKIEDEPAHPKHIITIWGAGYKWEA